MRLIDLCSISVRKINEENIFLPAPTYLKYLRRIEGTWEYEVRQ